ncbi:MAG: tetratricopeptide repeat protein [Candidatus Latescibacteria bacterium]|nr:tetratricopeptide repeat protein [Candidatus Latescibacterota bacterium]MBT4137201.1 tetratricopeptide repeat protein [Candidatus Latescibacterota bacterium]
MQKAVSLDATQAVIWYMLAQTSRLSQHIDQAHRHILKAIALKPSHVDYRQEHLNLGRIYEQSGDTQNTHVVYEEATRLTPHSPEAYIHLGMHHLKQNQYTEAASTFESALQVLPNDPRMLMGQAQALEQLGQIDTAIQVYRSVLSLMDSPEVRTHLNALLARKN